MRPRAPFSTLYDSRKKILRPLREIFFPHPGTDTPHLHHRRYLQHNTTAPERLKTKHHFQQDVSGPAFRVRLYEKLCTNVNKKSSSLLIFFHPFLALNAPSSLPQKKCVSRMRIRIHCSPGGNQKDRPGRRKSDPPASTLFAQIPVQFVGEILTVPLTEGRGASGAHIA